MPLERAGNDGDEPLPVQSHNLWCESFEAMPRGGSIVASLKLKGIDGLAPQAVDFAVQLDSTPKNSLGQNTLVQDGLMTLPKCVKGGAWPHEVRGVACLLNCDNGQDPQCMIGAQRLSHTFLEPS